MPTRRHRTLVVAAGLLLLATPCAPALAESDTTASMSLTDERIASGRRLWEAGQHAKAEKLLLEARAKAHGLGEKTRAADALADFYAKCGDTKRAAQAFATLVSDAAQASDTSAMVHAYDGLGRTYGNARQHVRAIKSYRRAEELLKLHPDTCALSWVYAGMARTLFESGDLHESLRLARAARAMTSEADLPTITTILGIESRVEAELGDYETAYSTLSEYSRLRRLLRDKEADYLISASAHAHKLGDTGPERLSAMREAEFRRSAAAEYERGRRMAFTASFALCIMLLLTLSCLAIAARRLTLSRREEKRLAQRVAEASRMLQIVGHDTTNHFNTLLGFAEMLVERTSKRGGDEEVFARHVYTSAQILYQATNNLLAWSKTHSQLKARREDVMVGACLANVVDTMRLMASNKDVDIQSDLGDNVSAYVDTSHLTIIVRNLLSNAIKYTARGGTVRISASRYADKVAIVVDDNGVGMRRDDIARFNSDAPLTPTDGTNHEKGNGIGLAICRYLARANDGDLVIEPGRKEGTSVTLVLNSNA